MAAQGATPGAPTKLSSLGQVNSNLSGPYCVPTIPPVPSARRTPPPIVADRGFVVDSGHPSTPNQPHNPNQPRNFADIIHERDKRSYDGQASRLAMTSSPSWGGCRRWVV